MSPGTLRPVVPTVPVSLAEEARAADAFTIDELKVPGIVLMEHAGRAVAARAQQRAGDRPVVVLAGPGNNGGDGWVAARHLLVWGHPAVTVIALRDPEALKGDARTAAATFLHTAHALGRDQSGPPVALALDRAAALSSQLELLRPAVVVDALFGTGLTRGLEGLAAEVVEIVSAAGVPVIAVDVPSGLPTDGAAPRGACIQATETVTFGGLKLAHVAEPGAFLCGDVWNASIGIVPRPDREPGHLLLGQRLVNEAGIERLVQAPLGLPAHGPAAHKGRFGHVAVLEGSPPTRGAARLAARAALRAGAGLVTLLVEDAVTAEAQIEVMQRTLASGSDARLDGFDAIVVGPGLGRTSEARARARAVLVEAARRDLPVVVDAEAIDLLVDGIPGLSAVATPHPGEAARVLGLGAADVQADRVAAARALQARVEGASVTWVLKGACPLVTFDDARLGHVRGGSPTLAVGGSGDVLAGLLGALLARGLSRDDAAAAGVVLHQRAGRTFDGRRGVWASEIADALMDVMAFDEGAGR